MLDIVMLILATISNLIVKAIAFVIDIVCYAALHAFLPEIEDCDPRQWNELFGVSDKMDTMFPFLRPANTLFITLAFIIVMVLFAFNIMKNFRPGIARGDSLPQHIFRAIYAVILVALSYSIIGAGMCYGYEAIKAISTTDFEIKVTGYDVPKDNSTISVMVRKSLERNGISENGTVNTSELENLNLGDLYSLMIDESIEEVSGDLFGLNLSKYGDDLSKQAITIFLPPFIMIAIAWNAIKLFLEMSERLVATTLITSLAPLGFCTVASEETEGIFKKYISMVFSTYFVFVLDIWFLRAFIYSSGAYMYRYAFSTMTEGRGVPSDFIWFMFLQLAWLVVAQRADQYLRDAGLSVAQTGGSLVGEMMLAGRAMSSTVKTGGRLAGSAKEHFNKARASSMVGRKTGEQAQKHLDRAIGKDSANKVREAGLTMTGSKDYVESVMKNGKPTGVEKGMSTNERGNATNFRIGGTMEEAKRAGHCAYINPVDGSCVETWSPPGEMGARDFNAPNGAEMSLYNDKDFVSAYNKADAVKAAGGTAEEADEAFRSGLGGGDREKMDESLEAARNMLPESLTDRLEPVAAGFNEADAEDVCHMVCRDKESGRYVEFDMTTGDPNNNDLFDGRSTNDTINDISGFSYSDNSGRQVTAMPYSRMNEDEFKASMGAANVEDITRLSDGSYACKVTNDNGREEYLHCYEPNHQTKIGGGRAYDHMVGNQKYKLESLAVEHGDMSTDLSQKLRRNEKKQEKQPKQPKQPRQPRQKSGRSFFNRKQNRSSGKKNGGSKKK